MTLTWPILGTLMSVILRGRVKAKCPEWHRVLNPQTLKLLREFSNSYNVSLDVVYATFNTKSFLKQLIYIVYGLSRFMINWWLPQLFVNQRCRFFFFEIFSFSPSRSLVKRGFIVFCLEVKQQVVWSSVGVVTILRKCSSDPQVCFVESSSLY